MTLESSMDCKEIKVLKEINPKYSLELTDGEAVVPIFWSPDVKSQLIGKEPDAGKVRR